VTWLDGHDGGRIHVTDLDSRNGAVLGSKANRNPELRLTAGKRYKVGSDNTVALPSGITVEAPGRSITVDGVRAAENGDDIDSDNRSTRLLGPR